MGYAVILILASCLCTGCMFEAQRAIGCSNVGVFGCKDKAPPTISREPSPREAETPPNVLNSSRDETKCSAVSRKLSVMDGTEVLNSRIRDSKPSQKSWNRPVSPKNATSTVLPLIARGDIYMVSQTLFR